MYSARPILLGWPLVLVPLLLTAAVQAQPLTVTRVIDGDTYELTGGRRVHLIGVETPERYGPPRGSRPARERSALQVLGERAARQAEALVLGRRVVLEYDRPAQRTSWEAHAYVHVVGDDGQFLYSVGERLIADGYATVHTQRPFAHADRYLTLQQQAAQEGRGLWGGPTAVAGQARRRRMNPELQRPPAGSSAGIDLLGGCSAHPDCVWVVGPDAVLGHWRSRAGGQCPCDD